MIPKNSDPTPSTFYRPAPQPQTQQLHNSSDKESSHIRDSNEEGEDGPTVVIDDSADDSLAEDRLRKLDDQI